MRKLTTILLKVIAVAFFFIGVFITLNSVYSIMNYNPNQTSLPISFSYYLLAIGLIITFIPVLILIIIKRRKQRNNLTPSH